MINAEIAEHGPAWRVSLIRARPWLCRAVPVAAALLFLCWCYVSVRSNFSWDDAEPEILNHAWRLARGEAIYRDIATSPFTFSTYTPLYFLFTGFLMKFTGLTFLPAKLLSFLSALSIGWAMARLDRQWNGNSRGGIWTAFFLFLIPAFLYNATRAHPQMMAVALSVWSLVFFLDNRWTSTVVLSPLLAICAVYTKQTQLALPLAMAAYLALRNRRWLYSYVATCTLAGLIPLLWLQKTTGGNFLLDTVQLSRLTYNVLQILPIFLHQAGALLPLLGLAAYTSWRRLRSGRWEPIDFYLACLMITTLISLGRVGAHGQYVVELLVVTLLYILRTHGLPELRRREILLSFQLLIILIYAPLFVFLEEGIRDVASNRAAGRIYPLLMEGSGPILSQQGSFALFSRGEIYIQLFHFTGLSRAGLWDQGLLLKEIENHTFSWVITEFPIEDNITDSSDQEERFTPEMLEALRRSYQRRQTIYPYYLYSARPPHEAQLPGSNSG